MGGEDPLPPVVASINSVIGSAFRAANDKRARSQQRALGMSELGGCRRQAGFKVQGVPHTNPPGERTDVYADGREAMVGTLIHDLVLPQIEEMSPTAQIERRVVLRLDGLPEIPGSADMVDGDVLIDLKTLGNSSIGWLQSRGPSKKHIWQTHGYAQALRDMGHHIEHIALVYVDRANGQVVHVHHQRFDPAVVEKIRSWWGEVNAVDDPMLLPRDERGPGVSRLCDWCCVPGTQVLLPDFTWKSIEDVRVGETLLAMQEPGVGRRATLAPTTVTATRRRIAPLVQVDGGLTVAADKKFWSKGRWVSAGSMPGKNAAFVAAPPKRDQRLYERGWLTGMAQGDGTFWTDWSTDRSKGWRRFRLAIAVDADEILGRMVEYGERAGFLFAERSHQHTGFSGEPSMMDAVRLHADADARRFEAFISEEVDDESWRWGFLGGVLDAEGSVTGRRGSVRVAQYPEKNPDVYRRIGECLERLGLKATSEFNGWCISSAQGQLWRFLAGATPVRPRFTAMVEGRRPVTAPVHAVAAVGEGEVVSLTTESGSYIAEGYVVHNCPWLKGCWGEDAAPGVSGVQSRVLEEVPDAERAAEVERMLLTYHAAGVAEREAREEKAYAREVLSKVQAGTYGSMILRWSSGSTYRVVDTDAAVEALIAAGIDVPMVERARSGSITVRPAPRR